jgi:outer membrane protein TolC
MVSRVKIGSIILVSAACWCFPTEATAEEPFRFILPEQKKLAIRSTYQLPRASVPDTPRPATVADTQFDFPANFLELDQAIDLALQNSEVVRVLTGVTANTSGRTVYDTAITNTGIDQERAAFDPQLRLNNLWDRVQTPGAIIDPLDPSQAIISGVRNDGHRFDMGLSQRNLTGGTAGVTVGNNYNRFQPGLFPLNPQNRSAVELDYTQPLLRGAGVTANRAPIVLARIDTERSYFQYKDSVQRLVQGVIEAYWNLVFAKTDLWAREQQVQQAEFAHLRAQSRVEVGDANAGELAQTLVALENFRATLLASQANVLQRQAALLNVLGLPAYEAQRTTPVTPMLDTRVAIDWAAINELAQRQRPDIIELKLVLEADQQRRLLAENQAQPQLDGVALYRWNGLEGEVPAGNQISSQPGQFDDWGLGVNFSVPLGLRRERATLRQQQLIIRRDRANLDQGLHQMQHLLALSVRNVEQYYAQYERYQAVRRAARTNLDQQLGQYNEGIVQFIVVLQAIVDWGNAVSAEAQALAQYNTELAVLELQTGTILESHGIVFFEERFAAIGPLGRHGPPHLYPAAVTSSENETRYPAGDQPSEKYFDLEDPVGQRAEAEDTPDMDLDLDEDVNFKSREGESTKSMSDEEIDRLLPPKRSSSLMPQFLRRVLRR